MYFKDFRNILYDFTTKTDKSKYVDIVSDLTTRVTTFIKPKDMDSLCDSYIITNDETPEQIAYKIYGNSEFHWTILYINEIADIYAEWPLSEAKLTNYCQDKYGSTLFDTKHTVKIPEYVVMDREAIESLYGIDFAVDVTNWDIEVQENEAKRFIKVIKPQFIGTFVEKFMKSLSE
jgi:hypothetical protein